MNVNVRMSDGTNVNLNLRDISDSMSDETMALLLYNYLLRLEKTPYVAGINIGRHLKGDETALYYVQEALKGILHA